MILGFKKQFTEKILRGTKIHTIREDKHNRWDVGKRIDFATGVRTKLYECFLVGICEGIQYIHIEHVIDGIGIVVFVKYKQGWRMLTDNEIMKLVQNDGFDTLEEFKQWFDKDLIGKIIHWTNLKY